MEWEIVHSDGTKGKIKHEEALRIAEMVREQETSAMEKRNCEYMHKAASNIVRLAGTDWGCPEDLNEDAVKCMLKTFFPFSDDQADLLFEIMEWENGKHAKHVFKA